MRCHALVKHDRFGGLANDPMKLARRDGEQGVLAREKPCPGLGDPPVVPQQREELGGMA